MTKLTPTSSTASGSASGTEPGKALDGDVTSFWKSSGANPSITLTFADKASIARVSIVNRHTDMGDDKCTTDATMATCLNKIKNAIVSLYVGVDKLTDCMTITEVTDNSVNDIDQTIIANCNGQIGDVIKISSSTDPLQIAEIRVYGEKCKYL